jgi:beta-1,2-mannobiose phosphorylase / 1,2-beta-oligomannan phosphorylase
VLFPEKIAGFYWALHRPVGGTPFTIPQMWIARSPDLLHWGDHQYLYGGGQDWETGRVGAGTPPLLLAEGWLEIYHGNRRSSQAGKVGAYCGGVMLLARDNPAQVLKIGREPMIQPEMEFEREGFVNDVVFPTGIIEADDRLLVYYGASDRYTGVAEFSRRALMAELTSSNGVN